MRLIVALLASSLLLAIPARGESGHLLVVLPLDSSTAQLDQPTRDLIEETIRTVAGDALRLYGYTVLTNDTTLAVLKDNGVNPDRICEASCALEAARELKAEVFISGKITTLEGSLVAIIRLTEPRAGKQLSSLQLEAPNVRQLRATLAQRLPELLLPLHRVAPRPKPSAPAPEGQIVVEPTPQLDTEPEEGLVRFESIPPGETIVRVDNELLCQKTPCSKALTLGPHTVTMERERYFAVTRTVTLEKDGSVQFTLDPNFGTLSIDTVPTGLTVSINEKTVGTSPIQNLELDPDVYPAIIADKCYLPEGQRVLIERGKHRDIQIAAKAREAKLKVHAIDAQGNDFHAKVSVDGREYGTTPGTFTVPACAETVSITGEDGRVWRKEVELEEGKLTAVDADFGKVNLMVPPRKASGRFNALSQGELAAAPASHVSRWAVVTGAVGAAVWAGTGVGALLVHSQIEDLPVRDPSLSSKQNTGKTLMILSNVGAAAFVVGVIGALASGGSR